MGPESFLTNLIRFSGLYFVYLYINSVKASNRINLCMQRKSNSICQYVLLVIYCGHTVPQQCTQPPSIPRTCVIFLFLGRKNCNNFDDAFTQKTVRNCEHKTAWLQCLLTYYSPACIPRKQSNRTGCKKKVLYIYHRPKNFFNFRNSMCLTLYLDDHQRMCLSACCLFFLSLVGCEIFNHFVECGAVAAIWLRALVDFFWFECENRRRIGDVLVSERMA